MGTTIEGNDTLRDTEGQYRAPVNPDRTSVLSLLAVLDREPNAPTSLADRPRAGASLVPVLLQRVAARADEYQRQLRRSGRS
jgi:hypothetical protein